MGIINLYILDSQKILMERSVHMEEEFYKQDQDFAIKECLKKDCLMDMAK